jgi:hypothetical protein
MTLEEMKKARGEASVARTLLWAVLKKCGTVRITQSDINDAANGETELHYNQGLESFILKAITKGHHETQTRTRSLPHLDRTNGCQAGPDQGEPDGNHESNQ